ncbi:MAG: hypothetical protein JWQ38_683 [Flavipsychrobacter sp.]|nr:hypothetical protein [Flavipsychrobacter sp.]
MSLTTPQWIAISRLQYILYKIAIKRNEKSLAMQGFQNNLRWSLRDSNPGPAD